jgi:O-antigen/teichoic acid export membrane protein
LALVPERALNRGLVREFTELAKKHHWGRRKLKRSMKAYLFIAMAGLIVCAMTAVIVIQMKQQISPD